MRILLVEDDINLSLAVRDYLHAKAFVVDCVETLADARRAIASIDHDAILLDLHLPDGDGLDLLPHLRRVPDRALVIVLTAKDRVSDRIRGLDAGADDYLIKPYDPAELLARLRAVGRRRSSQAAPVVDLGALTIDLGLEVAYRKGKPVELTGKEWALLRMMATRPDRIHRRDALQNALYGFDDEADSNTLDVFISRLRRKIGHAHIQTLRGLGYRLTFSEEST